MKRVEVTWRDAITRNWGWDLPANYAKDLKRGSACKTVGWLAADKKDSVVLALSLYVVDGKVGPVEIIPKAVIKRMRVLK